MGKKELLYLTISSFILTIIWISSNVYHAYATSTIDSLLSIQIAPISPEFDMQTINKIRQRIQVTPEDNATPSETPTPSPSVGEPTITPFSIQQDVTPTSSATPEGELQTQP